jgi:predicted aldo/keto reductase-like oxidoreductase
MDNTVAVHAPTLGFGFMRMPKVRGAFDRQLIAKMVDIYIQSGGSYFDTAYIYHGAEGLLKDTLVTRYQRERYQIATKLPVYLVSDNLKPLEIFDESISRLGIDYIDCYMLHGIDKLWSDVADNLGIWDILKRLRSERKVKRIGFSFHGSPEDLGYILTKHSEVDFVQLQINYADWDDEKIQSRELYNVARSHAKPVIVMEPVKGGLLAGDSSPVAPILKKANPNVSVASWAIRFAALLEGVEIVLSGMNDMEQITDNIATMNNLHPFTDEETNAINEAVEYLRNIPRISCTSCGYCVDSCPKQIKIPHFIGFLNESLVYNNSSNAKQMYDTYTGDGFFASTCIRCRKCEERCPQKLEITDLIARVSDLFDNKLLT